MMIETPLDHAHADMEAAPEDGQARLKFFERLADAELFMALQNEGEGDTVTPQVFDLGEYSVVLLFDREDRLTQFMNGPTPYAAVSGRAVAASLAEEALGLALNLEVAPSSFLLDPAGVSWLAKTVSVAPEETDERLAELLPPKGLPDSLVTDLDKKLSTGVGLARAAYLVATRTASGGAGHVLAFVDPVPGAEPALAKAVAELLTFSGLDAAQMDVGFFASNDPMTAKLAAVGLRFDLPIPDPIQDAPAAPGMDPAKPPKLI